MPLHPALAARLPLIAGFPAPITEITDPGHLQRWQEFCRPLGDYVPPTVTVEEAHADGPAGERVRVLLYRRGEATSPGCLVWAHGGGFSGGSTEMFEADGFAREFAARTGWLVVSVDYRLAGEGCRHPLPSDDVRTAWRWARDNAATLGVRTDLVSLGGASAGAALAAGVTVRLLQAGDPLPAALVLAYPLVHPLLPPLSDDLRRALREVPVALDFSALEAAGENPVVERYLGAPAATARGDSMAALADVTGFPPTVILTAEYDALRASGEAFAGQLAAAGTDVVLHQSRGLLHGFLDQPPVISPIEFAYRVLVGALGVLGRDVS